MNQKSKDIAYLARALKAPRISAMAEPLAERARQEIWSYEEYLMAVAEIEATARDSSGSKRSYKTRRLSFR